MNIPATAGVSVSRLGSGLKKPTSLSTADFTGSRPVPPEAIARDLFPDPGGRPLLPDPRFGRCLCRPEINGVKRPTPIHNEIELNRVAAIKLGFEHT